MSIYNCLTAYLISRLLNEGGYFLQIFDDVDIESLFRVLAIDVSLESVMME